MTRTLSALSLLLALVLGAAPLAAQTPSGTITGRVVDAASQQPLSGVTVATAARRAQTGADGRYTLNGVPAGPATVTAERLGYTTGTQQVTVAAGETVTANFVLTAQATALEELVVVGYGQQEAQNITGSVDEVSTEQFNQGRIISPEQLIAAKVAGVQVVDSGEPGSGVSIRIRGGTSISSSNEPLYVLDGVPLPVGGGLSAGRNPLNFLNPDDIANITVLKDASATAIYGSRGANGVIIIETKTGVRGAQLSYSGSISGSNVTREPDLLSAAQFRQVVAAQAPDKMDLLGSASTDWFGAVERSAFGQEHNLAFSGAADNMDYRLSLGYLDQEGIIRGSATGRFTAALNYNQRLFDDQLTVQTHVLGARTDDQFTPGGILGAAAAFAPTQPIRTASGNFFEWSDFTLAPNNPVAELALTTEQGTTYRSVGSVEARYETPFLEGLSATTRLGYDVAKSERRNFYPSILQSQLESSPSGQVNRSNPSETTGLVDAFLNYTRRLDQYESDFDVTGGYSYEQFTADSPYFEARGLSSDLLGPFGVPTSEEQLSRINQRESRLASFFGRVNYTLRDKYLLTLSVRRDGSSRFAANNQWGTFPSAAIGWRIGDEDFLANTNWLSDLKLRASWGVNGNQAFGDYLYLSTYSFGDAFSRVQFGDQFVNTIRPSAVDPNIKWEETTSYNLGFDYGLFGNRISGSVDYYFKDTDDLIFNVPVAAGTNLSNFVTTNIGSVKNRGLEFSINALVFDGVDTGFTWDAGFNASTNSNELVRINTAGGGTEQILVGGISGGVGSNIQVLQPGFPVNSFFVYQHKRGANGKPLYQDTNGDGNITDFDLYVDLNGDGVINQDDRRPFESPTPKWSFGHTSQMRFQSFDAAFTTRAQLGSYVYNNVASNLGNYSALDASGAVVNLHESVLDYGFDTPQYFSDVYVEDASFLRMENLTLGYTIPSFRGLEQLRLFGTVQNVFTLTDYSGVDPVSGLGGIDNNIYPRSRTFIAGVNVGF